MKSSQMTATKNSVLSVFYHSSFLEKIGILILLLYFVSIAIMPRIHGHLRYEDFLTPLLFLMIFALLRKSLLEYIFIPVLYFCYCFLITALNIIMGKIPLISFLIWGKELQYFLAFALICGLLVRKHDYITLLFSIIKLLILFGIVSGVYSLVLGMQGYYGIGYFNEPSSPSLSMLMYFNLGVLSVFYTNMIDRGNRRMFFVCSMILSCLTLMVGSRTGVMMILVFWGSWLFFSSKFKMTILFLIVFIGTLTIALLAVLDYNIDDIYSSMYYNMINNKAVSAAVSRASGLIMLYDTLEGDRFSSWKSILQRAFNTNFILGNGRGFTHMSSNSFNLELAGDSQYTVNLAEIGILGSIVFFLMLYGFGKKLHYKLRTFYISYLLAYLSAGMTMEVWQLSKGGQMFWIMTGLLLMFSRNFTYLSKTNFALRK